MTGKELIIYILENGLENEPIVVDGVPVFLSTIDDTSLKLNTGIESVKALVKLHKLKSEVIGNQIYIYKNSIKEIGGADEKDIKDSFWIVVNSRGV